MVATRPAQLRVRVDGKFFRLGEKKFFPKGVSYGPFAPTADHGPFASREQTARDFAQICGLGANVVRIYEVPPRWLLDLATEHELKLLIDVAWNKHLCFLDSDMQQMEARAAVRRVVTSCAAHPAVFAFSVANEIPTDVVRWSRARAVADFIDELVQEARTIDPDCLCTFTNFPPTEFLRPQNLDFICFNVYLHNRRPFENYLARLQMIADTRPLVLGECGIDSLREGEERKSEILSWQIEAAFRSGLAGLVVFSFTDDWFTGGRQIEDWQMGLTTRNRQAKKSFGVVQKQFHVAPRFPLTHFPKVSVVVASYNGAATLNVCLESLEQLNYPNYEVILVDDGSTDTTLQIAARHPTVRFFHHPANLGLSTARNTGIAAATGEIVAFTDADCRVDEDWLYYLAGDLWNSDFAGIGGHNFLPPDDSSVAAAVLVSPGGPAHVMLTDRQAEHIPGCNMAFYKWALEEVGGFDPVFRKAGDDVDLCWRLQQRGYKIAFSPAGFVWHYRRSTPGAYLEQQRGYGEAEALLVRKHPEYFNALGGSIWTGRIYTASKFGVLVQPPIIYRGAFASAGFQTLYAGEPALTLMLCTTLEYHVLVTLPLWVLSAGFPQLLPLAITGLALSVGVCVAAATQAVLPKAKRRFWSRPLVALLFFLQPIVRGWARYQGRLSIRSMPGVVEESIDSLALRSGRSSLGEVQYWADKPFDRFKFVAEILERLGQQGWQNRMDAGWSDFDVEIFGNRWSRLQLTTVAEHHPHEKTLVRCRLRTAWSLLGRVVFWSAFGFESLIVGWFGKGQPWLWLILLTMPLLFWFLAHQQRTLQRLIAVFLDQMARQWNLFKLPLANEDKPTSPSLT